jgi:hypothetical protein
VLLLLRLVRVGDDVGGVVVGASILIGVAVASLWRMKR